MHILMYTYKYTLCFIDDNNNESSQETVEGRRARVRSLFSESQLAILRQHYAVDPRPRREHLLALAQQLVLPLRVVQVFIAQLSPVK